ncbi:MAG: insulinase family protein [Candidatus Cloacimonetes bacterium]|nr:insulinase family protein [Candidatus Cloacimonadota bacterium]
MSRHLPRARSFLLDNGFKVIHGKTHAVGIICLHLYIRTGSTNESTIPPTNDPIIKIDPSGYSHFIEHLTFKSTPSFPLNGISDAVPRLGGVINAYTDFDCTCYHIQMPSEYYATALHILAEISYLANWSEDDVRIEKDVIIEEIKQFEQEPETDFVEYIQRDFCPDHPLSKPVLGTNASVQAATHQELLNFYHTHYTPHNSFLIVTGDYQENDLYQKTAQYFSDWKPSKEPLQTKVSGFMEPFRIGYDIRHRFYRSSKPLIAVVLPELSEMHSQYDQLAIATQLFCLGNSSNLYRRLVEQDKLCSMIKVHSVSGVLSGVTVILLFPVNLSKSRQIIDAFFDEMRKILYQPLSQKDMELVKKDLIYSWLYSFDSADHLAGDLAADEFVGGYERLYDYDRNIMKVTEPGLKESTRQYWQPDYIRIYTQTSTKQPLLPQLDYFSSCEVPSLSPTLTKAMKAYKQDISLSERQFTDPPYQQELHPDQYQFTLSNGMKVIIQRVKNRQSTGIALASSVSQLCDPPDKRGLNFLTSTALIYGSRFHDHDQIRSYSREHGLNIRVTHQTDCTSIRAKCLKENILNAFSLISELFYYPSFKSRYTGIIKRNVIDMIRREADYPSITAYNLWFRMLCGSKTNLHRSTGGISDLLRLSGQDIRNWHANYYTPENFTLCIVGDLDLAHIAGECQRYFDKPIEPRNRIENIPLFEPSAIRKKIKAGQSTQAYIHLGGFGCPATIREQNTAFHLLAQVLGGELNSRFYTILREKYGFAYQCGFDFHSCQSMGFWIAYAYCDVDDWKQTGILMHEIIDDVYTNGISTDELQTAQNYMIGIGRIDAESVGWQASTIATLQALGYESDYYFNRERRIRSVNLETIRSTAQQWLAPDNRFLHIIH